MYCCIYHNCRYLGSQLREPENSQWRAAGMLVYTFDKRGELLMLLGRPDYSDATATRRTVRRNTWNLLGEPLTHIKELTRVCTAPCTATPGTLDECDPCGV